MTRRRTLTWNVKWYSMNVKAVQDYDVAARQENTIRRLKKECSTKEEFETHLRSDLMRRYWSRSEYELIVEIDANNRVWLYPWCGCRNPELERIDVTDSTDFDWRGFAQTHISRQIFNNRAKIDIFDQLEWRWREFVDYCWHTRLKYERDNPKFHI